MSGENLDAKNAGRSAEKPMSAEDQNKFKTLVESLRGLKDGKATFYRVNPNQLIEADIGKVRNFHSFIILEEKELTEKDRDELVAILTREATYSETGSKCFDPGMAARFSSGAGTIDVVICLRCHWAYWYAKESPQLGLSLAGEKDLEAFYRKFFKWDLDLKE